MAIGSKQKMCKLKKSQHFYLCNISISLGFIVILEMNPFFTPKTANFL